MRTRRELIKRIKAYLKRTKVAPSSFGRAAAGNSNLVKKLEAGGTISIDTADKVIAYLDAADAGREDAKAPGPFVAHVQSEHAESHIRQHG